MPKKPIELSRQIALTLEVIAALSDIIDWLDSVGMHRTARSLLPELNDAKDLLRQLKILAGCTPVH